MAYDYNDPMASIGWLMAPNTLPETDTNAAQSAVAMGGMVGSPFAANNRLRLRDSERIGRLKLGQELLQPYLNRASTEGIEARRIAADSARQSQADLAALQRLTVQEQNALQRAILTGNQQQAHDILVEAGADKRQAATIAANLQTNILNNQQRSFEALLPYEQRNLDYRRATLPRYPSQQNPVVMNGGAGWNEGYSPVTASGSPIRPPTRSTGAGAVSMVNKILGQYGIGNGTGTGTGGGVPRDPYADWRASLPGALPTGAASWNGQPVPQQEFDWNNPEYEWSAPTSPDVQTMQNYYE